MSKNHRRSSRLRYQSFLEEYKQIRLDDSEESGGDRKRADDPPKAGAEVLALEPKSQSRVVVGVSRHARSSTLKAGFDAGKNFSSD